MQGNCQIAFFISVLAGEISLSYMPGVIMPVDIKLLIACIYKALADL